VAEFEGEVLEGAPALEILDEADRVVGTGKDAGAGAGAGQAAEAGAATRRLAATAQELPEGLYFVRLRGGEAAGTLAIRGAPPCPAGDDGNEDDDTAEAAKPVQNGGEPLSLRRCGGDDDWFRLELPAGESAQVSLAFTHEDGDLVLEAFDPKDLENPVEIGDESAAGKPGEVVALEAPADAAGVWLLRVRGATPDATNFYQLAIQDGQGGGGQGEDQEEEQQQAIDQQMQQLDEQTRDNLEAQKALEEGAALRIPGGKPW
ncbi:MAG: PPC domain-containing protein, partial [Deltaproteobacteria bacterium]|nr:PPC domain-containing protein [Deltaproteobacteria bacterium]